MRLFVGIKVSEGLQERVGRWQRGHGRLPVRFIKPENLHLTLVAPWYADDASPAIKKLKRVRFSAFPITFDRIAVNHKNRVLWLASSHPPKEMIALRDALLTRFRRPKEKRALRPHITLARWKRGDQRRETIEQSIRWKEHVRRITLFSSQPGLKEATYRSIISVPSCLLTREEREI